MLPALFRCSIKLSEHLRPSRAWDGSSAAAFLSWPPHQPGRPPLPCPPLPPPPHRQEDATEHVGEVLERVKPEYLRRAYKLQSWGDAEDFLAQVARTTGEPGGGQV